ncbi:MAG: RNA polymerase sigma factor [Acidimicrobiales bacterium]
MTDNVQPEQVAHARRAARKHLHAVDLDDPSDDALVDLARAGDQEAFEELVRRTYTDTYALALKLTGDPEDARDVAQDVYLRAFKALRRFRGEAKFSTWLYRITANCAATQLGRRKRHLHDDLEANREVADLHPDRDPELRVDASMLRDRVEHALSRLPDRLRAVVVLREMYDLTHEAIATELGITETAAKVRLHRARQKLREFMAERVVVGGDEDNGSSS